MEMFLWYIRFIIAYNKIQRKILCFQLLFFWIDQGEGPVWLRARVGAQGVDGPVQVRAVRAAQDDLLPAADAECWWANDDVCDVRQLQQPLEVLLSAHRFAATASVFFLLAMPFQSWQVGWSVFSYA